MPRSLPARPHLDHVKREAKTLLKIHHSGDASACSALRHLKRFERSSDEEILAAEVTLREAQQALAVEYGFESWIELRDTIAPPPPKLQRIVPVLGIDSYEEAVAFYVDWLGFAIDWEWREAEGRPVVLSISRDDVSMMLNEHPQTLRPSSLSVQVAHLRSLAAEWNERRPGSAQVEIEPPYEIPTVSLRDPFGNRLSFDQPVDRAEQAARDARAPRIRAYIRQELAEGRPCPAPEQIVEAVGGPPGKVIEVLGEFPEHAEATRERRRHRQRVLEIEAVELEPQLALVVQRRCPSRTRALHACLVEAIPQLRAQLIRAGRTPTGDPFLRYLSLTDQLTVEIGLPIDAALSLEEDFRTRELPSGKALTALARGPHQALVEAWRTLIEYAADQGHGVALPWGGLGGWQIHLDPSSSDPEESPRTRLYLPLQHERGHPEREPAP